MSPTGIWRSGEVQDIPFCKRLRIQCTILCFPIWEYVAKYGWPIQCPLQYITTVTTVVPRFSRAMRAKEKEAIAKDVAEEKEAASEAVGNLRNLGFVDVPNA